MYSAKAGAVYSAGVDAVCTRAGAVYSAGAGAGCSVQCKGRCSRIDKYYIQ